MSMSSVCYCQWKSVFQFPSPAGTIYFQDDVGHPEIGFAGLTDGEIWRTSDRGMSWQNVSPITGGITVSDITFKDPMVGWFITDRRVGTSAIFKTLDAGLSWQLQTPILSNAPSICYHKPLQRLFRSDWGTGVWYSDDDGATWIQFGSSTPANGFAFSDDKNGIISFAGASPNSLYQTTDGGVNWLFFNLASQNACWQPAAKLGTTTFFMFSEYTNTLTRSNDAGLSWVAVSSLSPPPGGAQNFKFSGCLRISQCGGFFVQTTSIGFYLSSDEGLSWQTIGGPSNEVDTRFCISGDDVFASDFSGQVWSYHGNFSNFSLRIPQASLNFVSNDCDTIARTISILSTHCDPAKDSILAATMGGGGSFVISSAEITPREFTSQDSIQILYHPSGIDGDTGFLTLHLMIGGKQVDTVLRFLGSSIARTAPLVLQALSTNLLSQDCDTPLAKINFSSNACLVGIDSIAIASLSGSNVFTLSQGEVIPRRFSLRDSILLQYHPFAQGNDTAFLALHFLIHGKAVDTVIRFVGRSDKPVASFSVQLDAGTGIKQLSLTPGKNAVLALTLSNDVPASEGLDSLTFDLLFNPNMLKLDSAVSPNGWNIRIREIQPGRWICRFYNLSKTDILLNQIITFFYFSSYLATDTVSTVILKAEDVFFDIQKHSGCSVASLFRDDSVIIHAADTCADPSIRHFLLGKPLISLLSIKPNPAGNEIRFELGAASTCRADIMIIDALGRIWRQIAVGLEGTTIIPVSLEALPSGEYHLLVRSESGSISAPFIKLN